MKNLLQIASDLVLGPRQNAYAHPLTNHERIARLFTARLHEKLQPGEIITPEDASALMRLVKEARLIQTPGHEDSLVDIAGYAQVEWMIHERRAELSGSARNIQSLEEIGPDPVPPSGDVGHPCRGGGGCGCP